MQHRYPLSLSISLSVITRSLSFSHRIVDTFLSYFDKKLSDTIIKENFSTVYQVFFVREISISKIYFSSIVVFQLLDEMIDGGFPFTTEDNQLKEMILPPSTSNRLLQKISGNFSVSGDMPQGGIRYIMGLLFTVCPAALL